MDHQSMITRESYWNLEFGWSLGFTVYG